MDQPDQLPAIRLAVTAPASLTVEALVALAQQVGADAIELHAAPERAAGLPLSACRAIGRYAHGDDAAPLIEQVRRCAQAACPVLCVTAPDPARPRDPAHGSFPAFLARAADVAAEVGVILAIENQGLLAAAAQLWRTINLLEHPAIGVAWDPARALAIGQAPAQAIPVLSSVISHIRLTGFSVPADAKAPDAILAPPSDAVPGNVRLSRVLNLLRGVGYRRSISIAADPANPAQAAAVVKAIRELLAPKVKAAPAKHVPARPTADKPAADKPVAGKPAAPKPTAEKPADERPAATPPAAP